MSSLTRSVNIRVGSIATGSGQILGSVAGEPVGVTDLATAALVTGGSGFTHPGVLLTAPMMTYTAGSIGVAPWSTAYATLTAGLNKNNNVDTVNNVGLFYSNTAWVPHPQAVVYRASGGGGASSGDTAEQTDAMAAYVQALMYAYTGNRTAGNNSVRILNAWMQVLTDHPFDTVNWADGKIQAAWCGSLFPRAAEIMRSLWVPSGGDQVLDVPAAVNCFQTAFVPRIFDGWTGGGANWLTSMAEAMIHIGVFCDDRSTFNIGVANWRGWTPSTVYQTGDVNGWNYTGGGSGSLPLAPTGTNYAADAYSGGRAGFITYWRSPTATPPWINGLQGEIGRDPWHAAFGLGAAINGAETAWHQGIDLYGEQQPRLVAGLELFAAWVNDVFVNSINPPTTGGVWPFAAAMGNNGVNNSQRATLEIAYNHYHRRLGIPMPRTLACLTNYSRTGTYNVNMHLTGENVTHRDNVASPVHSAKMLDTSNTIPNAQWFVDRYNEGFTLYCGHATVWGTSTPLPAFEQYCTWALAAGLKIAAYTHIPDEWSGGLTAAGVHVSQLQFFAFDVETGGIPVTQAMIDGVTAAGVRPVIFTGSGMWAGVMGATTFPEVKLWDINTSVFNVGTWVPDVTAPAPVGYAGWNTPGNPRLMVQQQVNVTLGGVVVDVGSVRSDWLLADRSISGIGNVIGSAQLSVKTAPKSSGPICTVTVAFTAAGHT